MFGGGGKPSPPPTPSPAPMPVAGVEQDEAKKKLRKPTGRENTILADRMMTKVNNPYQLKDILG
jgi:hypothetical protein